VALALLMMRMLGVQPEERGSDEALARYRERVLGGSFSALSGGELGLSSHTIEIVRRLLTPGGFDSPGEVVVELASAMLLRRAFGPTKAEGERPAASAETVEVSKDSDLISDWLADAEEKAAASETPVDSGAASFTPFFVWHSRHGGIFFVVHDGEELSIGRDPDYSDVALMDPAISRKHCIISKRGNVIRLEDPGSTNGTFVNGVRVESAEIHPGDSLRIGATRVYMTLSAQDE